MYRKEAVEKAGGYQHFYLFEDYYLWARMLLLGVEARNLPDTLLYMRAGTGTVSYTHLHVINYLLFKALSGIDTVSQWIAWVTAIRIITVFSGVNHSKVSIALKQDGITVIRKRDKMNF